MDFLSQLPPTVLILFIVLPIVILFSLVGIITSLRRGRRTKSSATKQNQKAARQQNQQTQAESGDLFDDVNSFDAAPVALPEEDGLLDVMPELDLLAALENVAPEPEPAPMLAPEPVSPYHTVTDSVLKVQLTSGETDAVEVLTVLRDERDGRLMVQMNETAYRSLTESPDVKKNFTRIMKELSSVITKPDTMIASAPAPQKPKTTQPPPKAQPDESMPSIGSMLKPAPEEPKPQQQGGLLSSLDDASEATSSKPPTASRRTSTQKAVGGALPGDLPSYRFEDNPAKLKGKRLGFGRVESDLPPIMDIPSAIEEYLQYKLDQPSEYQGRDFHVQAAPSGGVQILVDNQVFEAVDDITDPNIRAFIRQAIDEWSARNM